MGNRTIEKDPNLSPRNYLWGVRGMASASHRVVEDLHYALSRKGTFLRAASIQIHLKKKPMQVGLSDSQKQLH